MHVHFYPKNEKKRKKNDIQYNKKRKLHQNSDT